MMRTSHQAVWRRSVRSSISTGLVMFIGVAVAIMIAIDTATIIPTSCAFHIQNPPIIHSKSVRSVGTFPISPPFTTTSTGKSLYRQPNTRITKASSILFATDETTSTSSDKNTVDVIVIGSGLAGLSCAALLAHCGRNVSVLESHDRPGGAAHTWTRMGFHFESGPSLYSGFSLDRSPNPLKNIFQIVQEDCEEWIQYDRWGTVLPNGKKFAAKIGPEEFDDVLRENGGPNAVSEFHLLMERMKPLSDAAQALTSMALREDIWVGLTLLRYPRELVRTLSQGQQLTSPFIDVLNDVPVKDKFVRNWLDMLSFLLQGLPASGTLNTVMAYMLADWYRPGVVLDYPKGGSGAIVDALVRAVRKHGSTVSMNSHVDEILVENGKAVGVRLANGQIINANVAVVSNADPYITNKLLSNARANGELSESMNSHIDKMVSSDVDAGGMKDLRSFIHIHAGIDAEGLPEQASADFPAQWAVIRSWDGPEGVEDPRNIVLCSIPSLLDPSMAPEGKHVIHAYTPATEPCKYNTISFVWFALHYIASLTRLSIFAIYR